MTGASCFQYDCVICMIVTLRDTVQVCALPGCRLFFFSDRVSTRMNNIFSFSCGLTSTGTSLWFIRDGGRWEVGVGYTARFKRTQNNRYYGGGEPAGAKQLVYFAACSFNSNFCTPLTAVSTAVRNKAAKTVSQKQLLRNNSAARQSICSYESPAPPPCS